LLVGARRGGSANGFTLIEVMLALAILGFITTIMWGSFSQTANNKKAIEAAQERLHTVRVALLRMAREIEMAPRAATSTSCSSRASRTSGCAPAPPRGTPRSSPITARAIPTTGGS
jgi:prepilin-type N-terminal cleavage/methylation domain-containing protein